MTNLPRRRVIQYWPNGMRVAEFQSVREASEKTGIGLSNIWQCALGRRPTAGGYRWEFAALVGSEKKSIPERYCQACAAREEELFKVCESCLEKIKDKRDAFPLRGKT